VQIIKHLPPLLLENRLLISYLLGILWKLPSTSVPICGDLLKCETGILRINSFEWSYSDSADPNVHAVLRPGSTLGLWFRNPQEHGRLSLVNVVCCQFEDSALGRSLVQMSPTECGLSVMVKPR
jgi:hypothetical protein